MQTLMDFALEMPGKVDGKEEWRLVDETPRYEVSNMGRVRRRDSHRMPIARTKRDGYPVVQINSGGKVLCKQVHRLVALAFLPKPPTAKHTHVNHINGVRHDPRASNLEWVTPSENMRHWARQRKANGGMWTFGRVGGKAVPPKVIWQDGYRYERCDDDQRY